MFVDAAILPAVQAARKGFKKQIGDDRIFTFTPGTKYKTIYEVMAAEKAAPQKFDGAEAQKTAWLCYSSGTTGLPKGVMTSHYNMTTEVQAINLVFPKLVPGQDSILGVLPMSHMYGLVLGMVQPITIGVPIVLFPKFDEIPVLEGIQKVSTSFQTSTDTHTVQDLVRNVCPAHCPDSVPLAKRQKLRPHIPPLDPMRRGATQRRAVCRI